MIRYAAIDEAKQVVLKWNGISSTVEHLGDRGNSVFSFRNSDGRPQILRFTDNEFRSFAELNAELNFVNYLHSEGVPVAHAIPTSDGELSCWHKAASGDLICSSVAYAPGHEVLDGSPHWNSALFREWGRNLGLIHKGAAQFSPPSNAPQRWQWDKEILITKAGELIPIDDKISIEAFHEIMDRCLSLPQSPSEFGLIHADHAPQNFRYEPETNRITAFDFGNCCHHWFVSDLAISLSTIRRKPNREEIRNNILEGYSTVRELPPNYTELIDLFIRLRVMYVYLSRLHLWSDNRTQEQSKELSVFQERVHEKIGW